MNNKYSQVPLSYLEPIFTQWLSVIDRREVQNVFFLPYGDVLFRAMQFEDWCQSIDRKCVLMHMETELLNQPENLNEALQGLEVSTFPVLVARRAFISPDGQTLSQVLEKFYALGKGVLVLHEGFPVELDEHVKTPFMSQHRHLWQIYPSNVAREYVLNTAMLWKLSVSEQLAKDVAGYCAGIPWLMNEALRSNERGEDWRDSSAFWWKVEKIWNGIPSAYKDILMNERSLMDQGHELVQFGLVRLNLEIAPFLADWLEKRLIDSLVIEPGKIVHNQVDLTHAFSVSERRVLSLLWRSPTVISRTDLGKEFWLDGKDTAYSDWALDQLISRLRRKCKKFGLPLKIVTKKGVGYVRG